MYKSERLQRIKRQRRARAVIKICVWLAIITTIISYVNARYDVRVQSPIIFSEKVIELKSPLPDDYPKPGPEPKPMPSATPGAELKVIKKVEAAELRTISGKATYYSREGCVGCDPDRIMANGEPLDDSKFTVALTPEMVRQYKLLNKYVTVTNSVGKSVRVRVTDTGGFGKYGRIADLSVATRDALNCKSLCEITLTY